MSIECYDIGGTWIRGAIFNENRKIVKKIKKEVVKDFCSQIKQIHKDLSSKSSSKISIAVPGPVSNGLLTKAPPLGIDYPIDLKKELKDLGKEIYIENDLNAAVEAELNFGTGKYCNNFYLLTISTGIGVGLVLNKNIIQGTSGEFGHNVLERRNEFLFKCGCGNYGCWVSLCGGNGIKNLENKLIGKNLSPAEVFERAKSGDKKAKDLVKRVRDYNAQGLGIMINAIEVDKIIIMGSIGLEQFSQIIPKYSQIRNYTINKIPKIERTSLGDDICLIGSYLIAKDGRNKDL
nr:ROK family protein [Candidatus Woesearchaeota archaeon]